MRIIFMGTPEFAVPSLNALVEAGHDVIAAYSQPPRPAGRGKALTLSAVHKRAEELAIPVYTPLSLRAEEAITEFMALESDLAVVAAYGLILPRAILDAPVHGCINVHGSILPRWRGAAPVQRAILAGDKETGVTIMQMDIGLDTGAMLAMERTSIDGKTAGELTAEIADIGAGLLVQSLSDLPAYPPQLQPESGITYAAKIDKSESRLDFLTSAVQVERQVRAFAPVPGAFFEHRGERFRVLEARVLPPETCVSGATPGSVLDNQLTIACNPGAIQVTRIQRAGKGPMMAAALLRGFAIPAGTRLS